MHVASQQLCVELYKLSDWKDTDKFWFYEDSFPDLAEWEIVRHDMDGRAIPAYDLGYLMRKLAEQTTLAVRYVDADNHHGIDLKQWYGKWIAYTPSMQQGIYPYADIPEDAAAKLAIELFYEDILTKGQE